MNMWIFLLLMMDQQKKNNLVFKKMARLGKIEVLNLKNNVKAQIAIATGLNFLRKEKFQGGIIVMDADGQDDPEYLIDVIKESQKIQKELLQSIELNAMMNSYLKFYIKCIYFCYFC